MLVPLSLCCLLALSLGAADDGIAIGDALLRPIIPENEIKAKAEVDAFDARMAEIRRLPHEQRRTREERLGPELDKLLQSAAGTKIENKVLYLLAHWRFVYRDGIDVDPLIDRILANPYPGYQNPAKALRVQLLLKQGRLAEARAQTDLIVAAVPELAGLDLWCRFHELVGSPAPRTAGTPLAGAPADPATRSEPWLLYYFTGALDESQRDALGSLLAEVTKPAYAGVLRVVVVAESSNPLSLVSTLSTLGTGDRVDLLWSNPADDGDARAWRTDWRIPQFPVAALLGPDRRIAAIDPSLAQLGILIGKTPEKPKTHTPTPGGKPAWQR